MDQPAPQALPQSHTLAIVSLVLAILGLTFILPLVGPIGAIITGNIALKEIKANPARYTGEGNAKAGIILGWIGVGLTVLGCLAVFAFLLFLLPFTRIDTRGLLPALAVGSV